MFADSIRASSLNRLHQQAGQKTAPDQCHCVNLSLATREPSTEDIAKTYEICEVNAPKWHTADILIEGRYAEDQIRVFGEGSAGSKSSRLT